MTAGRGVHILTALALIAGVFSCGRKEKIIPRAEMVDIYADLLIADQWVTDNGNEYKVADTTLFYEPIFNKYGYTTLDFRNSADYYLRDPRRFSRILQRTSVKLGERASVLEKEFMAVDARIAEIESLMSAAPKALVFYDSLFFANCWTFSLDMLTDERGVYVPSYFIFPDSLSVGDLTPSDDTLRVAEPLPLDDETEMAPLEDDLSRPMGRMLPSEKKKDMPDGELEIQHHVPVSEEK